MLLELIRCISAMGLGAVLGWAFRTSNRAASPPPRRPIRLKEASVACNPLQVIGGGRRGPGRSGEA